MKLKETVKLWIARDKEKYKMDCLYNVSNKKMKKESTDYKYFEFIEGLAETYCIKKFERLTKIKLIPGDQIQVEVKRIK